MSHNHSLTTWSVVLQAGWFRMCIRVYASLTPPHSLIHIPSHISTPRSDERIARKAKHYANDATPQTPSSSCDEHHFIIIAERARGHCDAADCDAAVKQTHSH